MSTEPDHLDVLVQRRARLIVRVEEEREQLEVMEEAVASLKAQRARDEFELRQIDSVLGKSHQIQLEDASLVLRGHRIREVAVQILEAEGRDAELHYRDWYGLLRSRGHFIVGKDPVNTFRTEINRSPRVVRVGTRTGRYRLLDEVA